MDGSGVVMRILNKDEITTDEKMNNSYAELLYSCACVFEMFAYVEHQCPMMTDRDIAKMLTRVPWEGMGGRTYL